MNNNDSFIDKQLKDTGYTFFLINKNEVKNVFKQQDSEASQNDILKNNNDNPIGKIEKDGLKILGDGKLTKALTVKANKFTQTAIKKIQKAGGTIEEA